METMPQKNTWITYAKPSRNKQIPSSYDLCKKILMLCGLLLTIYSRFDSCLYSVHIFLGTVIFHLKIEMMEKEWGSETSLSGNSKYTLKRQICSPDFLSGYWENVSEEIRIFSVIEGKRKSKVLESQRRKLSPFERFTICQVTLKDTLEAERGWRGVTHRQSYLFNRSCLLFESTIISGSTLMSRWGHWIPLSLSHCVHTE